MNKKWKQTMTVCLISAALLIPPVTIRSFAQVDASAAAAGMSYRLTGSLSLSVKSILNEMTPDGTRLGAVIRLYNDGPKTVRVPDGEIRVTGEDGTAYTLRPSASNGRAVQSKETVELSYMAAVDRYDAFALTGLSWVEVDEYVYPKEENTLLSMPISSLDWKGDHGVPGISVPWGDAFPVPTLDPGFVLTPVSWDEQNTAQGPVILVGLLAANHGGSRLAVPDLRIDGRAGDSVFVNQAFKGGNRLEKGDLTLEPGQQAVLHYAIPAGKSDGLTSLTILTPEAFAGDRQNADQYFIGRVSVVLPQAGGAGLSAGPAEAYEWNRPVAFDPLTARISSDAAVSLTSLDVFESEDGGFTTAVARFRLQNNGTRPLPVPSFEAFLLRADGSKYEGSRQKAETPSLLPHISYTLEYSFLLPAADKGEAFVMELADGETAPPYKLPIARFQPPAAPAGPAPAVQQPSTPPAQSGQSGSTAQPGQPVPAAQPGQNQNGSELDFDPYLVSINKWSAAPEPSKDASSYKVTLDLGIRRKEGAVIAQNVPKLKLEIADADGTALGSKTFLLNGDNRLAAGVQTFAIPAGRTDKPLVLRVYEKLDTPYGSVQRLVKTLQP